MASKFIELDAIPAIDPDYRLPGLRLLTPEERAEKAEQKAREKEERERYWTRCVCCQQKRQDFSWIDIPVCSSCLNGRYGYQFSQASGKPGDAVYVGAIRRLIWAIEREARIQTRTRRA